MSKYIDNTFIRKDFYVDPPKKNASLKEWRDWIKADNKKAAVAKAQHTKEQEQGNIGMLPHFNYQSAVKGKNGVYKQQTFAVGLVGDFESGNGQITPIQKATQELAKRARGKRSSIRRSKKSKKKAKSKKIFH